MLRQLSLVYPTRYERCLRRAGHDRRSGQSRYLVGAAGLDSPGRDGLRRGRQAIVAVAVAVAVAVNINIIFIVGIVRIAGVVTRTALVVVETPTVQGVITLTLVLVFVAVYAAVCIIIECCVNPMADVADAQIGIGMWDIRARIHIDVVFVVLRVIVYAIVACVGVVVEAVDVIRDIEAVYRAAERVAEAIKAGAGRVVVSHIGVAGGVVIIIIIIPVLVVIHATVAAGTGIADMGYRIGIEL
jgi:hypothetical protein